MKTTFKNALMQMGYRQPDPTIDANRWAKPIGYNIFIAHEKELRLNCHFKANDPEDKLHCWETKELDPTMNLTHQIATFEQYTDCRGVYNPTVFAFLSKAQKAELMLDLL
jgi:hypothetical protein